MMMTIVVLLRMMKKKKKGHMEINLMRVMKKGL